MSVSYIYIWSRFLICFITSRKKSFIKIVDFACFAYVLYRLPIGRFLGIQYEWSLLQGTNWETRIEQWDITTRTCYQVNILKCFTTLHKCSKELQSTSKRSKMLQRASLDLVGLQLGFRKYLCLDFQVRRLLNNLQSFAMLQWNLVQSHTIIFKIGSLF